MPVNKMLWVAITDEPFIPKSKVNGIFTEKLPKDWSVEETKKASYDIKESNILISTLSIKVYYSILHYKSAQSIWNTLQVLYEGTENVKDSKVNMFDSGV